MTEIRQRNPAETVIPEKNPNVRNGLAINEVGRNQLIKYNELQEWQKDNEYILTSYRKASYSFAKSLSSIFAIHNETVNIWSHGLGFLGYSMIPLALALTLDWNTYFVDRSDGVALGIFFGSVTVCFIFSSCFHIFLNHSPQTWYFTSQLDHLGIVLVIWGSVVPSVHFGFHDNTQLRRFYWNLATASAALAGVGTMHPKFRTPAGRRLRFLFYCLLGSTTFISAFHGVMVYGYAEQYKRMGLGGFIGLGLLNFTGAAIYAARIPERWYPEIFDLFGASHQIMHVLVAWGAFSHATGLVSAVHYWNGKR